VTDERPPPIVCDAAPLAPDLVTIDQLARLVVLARRLGAELRIEGISPELRALLRLCGVSGIDARR
jgi:anti-anti-sigma regulatory factor